MPLEGWDHLEFWVGNAKQAAYFYEHAFGFTPTPASRAEIQRSCAEMRRHGAPDPRPGQGA